MELHTVYSRFLAPYRRVDELLDEFLYLAVRECPDVSARHLAGLAFGRAWRSEHQSLFHHLLPHAGRYLVHEFRKRFAHLAAHVGEGHHVDHYADVLPARMMQLNEEFRAVAVYAVGELAHRRDMVIVRHGELIERRGTVVVVDSRDLRDDESRTAFRPLFVIIHEHFRRLPRRLAESHHHGGHDYAVLDLASAYLHRRKQHFVFHIILP